MTSGVGVSIGVGLGVEVGGAPDFLLNVRFVL